MKVPYIRSLLYWQNLGSVKPIHPHVSRQSITIRRKRVAEVGRDWLAEPGGDVIGTLTNRSLFISPLPGGESRGLTWSGRSTTRTLTVCEALSGPRRLMAGRSPDAADRGGLGNCLKQDIRGPTSGILGMGLVGESARSSRSSFVRSSRRSEDTAMRSWGGVTNN